MAAECMFSSVELLGLGEAGFQNKDSLIQN